MLLRKNGQRKDTYILGNYEILIQNCLPLLDFLKSKKEKKSCFASEDRGFSNSQRFPQAM
jgi:hypothetical protein